MPDKIIETETNGETKNRRTDEKTKNRRTDGRKDRVLSSNGIK